jgi:hypothetical protein
MHTATLPELHNITTPKDHALLTKRVNHFSNHLADPKLLQGSRTALNDLTRILHLTPLYPSKPNRSTGTCPSPDETAPGTIQLKIIQSFNASPQPRLLIDSIVFAIPEPASVFYRTTTIKPPALTGLGRDSRQVSGPGTPVPARRGGSPHPAFLFPQHAQRSQDPLLSKPGDCNPRFFIAETATNTPPPPPPRAPECTPPPV